MAKIRVTFAFSSGKHGWSETYFRDSTMEESVAAAKQLATLRKGCIVGQICELDWVRISDDAVKRDAFVFEGDTIPFPKKTCRDIDPAPPWNCRLCRLSNAQNPPRFLELRTIPQLSLGPAQKFFPVPAFDNALDTFLEGLFFGWAINSTGAGGNVSKPITGYANAAGIVTATCPAHGFAVGQQIRISGGAGAGRPQGLFKVANITVNTFDLIAQIPPFIYLGGSTASAQAKALRAINRAVPVRNSHRDTGRPLSLQAGRARARR